MGFAPDKSLLGFSTRSSLLRGSGGAGPSSITASLVWGVGITLSGGAEHLLLPLHVLGCHTTAS